MNKKINIIRTIFLILSIITCIVIFMFSNQNGEKSGNTSKEIIEEIIENIPQIKEKEEKEKEKIIEKMQPIIRKMAHFSIYMILAINVTGFINTYEIKNKNKIIISIMCCAVYAISDEVHQNFSVGRSPQIMDVIIDTIGSIFGTIIYKIIFQKLK